MSFERVVFGHATHADGELAHLAAAILHRHDARCTVADAGTMNAAIAACPSEEASWGEFVVIGKAAKDLFPDKLKTYMGETVFAEEVRRMAEEDYPDAEKIRLVVDNLSTHTASRLSTRPFPPSKRGVWRVGWSSCTRRLTARG